jgi:SAM-dependent methyltransferase
MAHALGRTDEQDARVVVACAVCGSVASEPFHAESGFVMARCRDCGFHFVNPRPPAGHRADHHHDYLPASRAAVEAWRRMMDVVRGRSVAMIRARVAPPARVLDVGCGFGFFLEAMRTAGYDTLGLEVGAPGLAECRRLGLEVQASMLEEAGLESAAFDVVTSFYVIEHVHDPAAFVCELRRLLAPGGLLLLRWPHSTPLVRLTRGYTDLKLYDLPSHLQDFAPDTMTRLLTQAGFTDIRHTVGGFTRPVAPLARWAAAIGGVVADGLERVSGGRWLLPGVSKSTLASAPAN